MDRLSGIAVFVRVVETMSFSRAAEELGLSKSTVSKQIRRLEDRLGVQLLHRTTRSMSLTDVGQSFYERCAAIVAEAIDAERAVTDMQSTPTGRLRVNAPMSFGQRHLAAAVSEFLRRCPGIEIELTLADRMVDIVDEGVDVAVRIAHLPDSSLIAVKLAPCRRVVVASPDYLQAAGRPETPHDLTHHSCLLYSLQSSGDTWHFRGPGDGGVPIGIRVDGPLRVNNGDAIARAALDGMGVAFLPTFIVHEALADGRLVALFPDHCPDDTAIYAVYAQNRNLSPKVRVFVDFLKDRFGDVPPPWDAKLTAAGAPRGRTRPSARRGGTPRG